ncbi:hypothetical protein BDV23DRAFT_150300 [Aspergillus alliaceus]|uniref:Uncharacterized protein n=1 Tax=Petromyces alliaceus TaxID=209559 RepID=A0A5N7CGV7_PETAA|nr:hypothetical protein BDV23DRAFT_150300 [Aspergillus alliaceus]
MNLAEPCTRCRTVQGRYPFPECHQAPLAEYVPTANGLIEPVSAPYVMSCGKTLDGVYQRQPGTLLEAPINLDPDEGDAGNPINLDPEEGEMVENQIIL